MTRRRVLLLGSVAVLAALVLAVMAWVARAPSHAPLTAENIEKIRADRLDRAQIQEFIGPGEGDETQGVWVGESMIMEIDFAPDGTFTRIHIQALSSPESLLSRLHRWLGL
jgi:hypothetical protein